MFVAGWQDLSKKGLHTSAKRNKNTKSCRATLHPDLHNDSQNPFCNGHFESLDLARNTRRNIF
jgi:hypothetical protein